MATNFHISMVENTDDESESIIKWILLKIDIKLALNQMFLTK